MVDKATTVNVNVSWTPGYDGGYPQTFKVKYRETELNGPFTTSDASNTPIRAMFVVTELRPETEYEFRVLGSNVRGDGMLSNSELFTTPSKEITVSRLGVCFGAVYHSNASVFASLFLFPSALVVPH